MSPLTVSVAGAACGFVWATTTVLQRPSSKAIRQIGRRESTIQDIVVRHVLEV